MKKLITPAILFILLITSSFGQNAEGEWNGTLEVPGFSLEMSITLIQEETGWSGSLDIPIQNIDDMVLANLSIQGKDFYFDLPDVPGTATYSGTFDEEYETIKGNFSQSGQTLTLDFIKASIKDFERAQASMAKLTALADSLIIKKKVPGLAIAIVKDNKILMSQGFGFRDFEHKEPVDENTIFAIGSSTKAFVSAGLAILADRGKLEWDSPVRSYLSDFEMKDEFASKEMTSLDLVTHRSGLPRHDLLWYGSNFDRKELFNKIKFLEPTEAFRTKFQYQNLMFMTAGIVIEEQSGKSWESFTEEEIFKPLGMTRSNLSVDESLNSDNFALPYKEHEDEIVRIDFRNIDAVGPAGSINSTISDMTQWVKLQLNKGKYGQKQIISDSQFDVMHEPQMIIGKSPLSALHAEFSPFTYGAGWFIYEYEGHKIVQHGGNIDGFSAYVHLLPEENVGMVILSNKSGTKLPTVLALHATDLILDKKEIDWASRYYPEIPEEKEKDKNIADKRKKNTRPSHPLPDYAGIYSHPAYGEFTVIQKNAQLYAQYNHFNEELMHYHYDVFEMELTDLDQKMKLQFYMDEDGNITSLGVPIEPMLGAQKFHKNPPNQIENQNFIQTISGDYSLEGQKIIIKKKGEKLTLNIAGQPEYSLVSYQKDEFRMKELPDSFSVKFFLDENRDEVQKLMFYQPNGIFTAKPMK